MADLVTLPNPARIKAFMFDLDGTLLDTLDDLADAGNAMLASLGLPGHAVAAYQQFVGDGIELLVRRALPAARRDDRTVALGVARVREHYAAGWSRKTRVYDGIPELLDYLAGRQVALTVLSNKPDEFTRAMVAHYFQAWPVAAVRGATAGQPRKPDPGQALAIAAELGLGPASFWYLGDTATDMLTARAAGMYAVGALWGFRSRAELEAAGAHTVAASPRSMVSLLEQILL